MAAASRCAESRAARWRAALASRARIRASSTRRAPCGAGRFDSDSAAVRAARLASSSRSRRCTDASAPTVAGVMSGRSPARPSLRSPGGGPQLVRVSSAPDPRLALLEHHRDGVAFTLETGDDDVIEGVHPARRARDLSGQPAQAELGRAGWPRGHPYDAPGERPGSVVVPRLERWSDAIGMVLEERELEDRVRLRRARAAAAGGKPKRGPRGERRRHTRATDGALRRPCTGSSASSRRAVPRAPPRNRSSRRPAPSARCSSTTRRLALSTRAGSPPRCPRFGAPGSRCHGHGCPVGRGRAALAG